MAAMRAMVLCAGFGTRMKEFTRDVAKPMLRFGEKPLLQYTVENLVSQGIADIGVNLHYKAEQIRDYFGDGSKFGARISYVYEEAPSGTAGAAKVMEEMLVGAEQFLLIYGDILTDQDFRPVMEKHLEKNAVGTVVLHKRQKSNSIVELDDRLEIVSFQERPDATAFAGRSWFWVNSGIYVLNSQVLNLIPKDTFCDFPKDVFPQLIAQRGLFGFPLSGRRWAIDTPDRYFEAKEALKEDGFKFLSSGT